MAKILIIQYDDLNTDGICKAIESQGCDITKTDSFKHGYDVLSENYKYDLIIATIQKPNADFINFLNTLNRKPRYEFLPIIAMMIEGESSVVKACVELGLRDIIMLPTQDDNILPRIEKAINSGRPSVLIVDDDPDILSLLEYIVSLERFKALTAPSVDEALDIMERQKIDAVISDIVMPTRSGIELLKIIRHQYPQIPVMLITGYSGEYRADKALEDGADEYLTKPFNNIRLIRKLKKMLGQKRQALVNQNTELS